MLHGHYALFWFTWWSVPCSRAIWADLCNSCRRSQKHQLWKMSQQEAVCAEQEWVGIAWWAALPGQTHLRRSCLAVQWGELYLSLQMGRVVTACHLAFSSSFQVIKFCLFCWVFLAAFGCVELSSSCMVCTDKALKGFPVTCVAQACPWWTARCASSFHTVQSHQHACRQGCGGHSACLNSTVLLLFLGLVASHSCSSASRLSCSSWSRAGVAASCSAARSRAVRRECAAGGLFVMFALPFGHFYCSGCYHLIVCTGE